MEEGIKKSSTECFAIKIKKKNRYDKVVKYLPLLTIIVFLLGYSYQDSYYKEFNINILLYESNSEILYTLLPLSILIFGSCIGLLTNRGRSIGTASIEKTEKRKRINPYIALLIIILTLIGLKLILRKLFGPFRDEPLISLLTTISIISFIGYDYIIDFIRNKVLTTFYIFLFTVTCGYLSMEYAKSKAYIVKQLGNENQYFLFCKDKIIETNDKYFVIGETQGFVFFYNKNDSSTNIMSRNEIDSLKIKKFIK